MKKSKLLIFDFDGTLVDTLPDIAFHVNETFTELGLPTCSQEAVRLAVGRGVRDLIRDLSGLNHSTDAELGRVVEGFRKHYLSRPVVHSKPYEGVREALAGSLKAHPKMIVTNKLKVLTEGILAEVGLLNFFKEVIGDGSPFPKKPDPTAVHSLMKKYGFAPEETVFIGDSKVDQETACRAGIHFVWVAYGYDRVEGASLKQMSSSRDLENLMELFTW